MRILWTRVVVTYLRSILLLDGQLRAWKAKLVLIDRWTLNKVGIFQSFITVGAFQDGMIFGGGSTSGVKAKTSTIVVRVVGTVGRGWRDRRGLSVA